MDRAAGTTRVEEPAPKGRARLRVGAVVVATPLVGVAVWLAIGSKGPSSSRQVQTTATTASTVGPVAVSPEQLRSLTSSVAHPVYWAGPRANMTYELAQNSNGSTFVRYLPKGVPVGDPGNYLTVATYPLANAFAVTQRTGQDPKTVMIRLPSGGIAVYGKPTAVFLAYPGVDAQIEVFDPSPLVPSKLAQSGEIVPVG
jgi:hypothetical protein